MSNLFQPDLSIEFEVGPTTIRLTPSFRGQLAFLQVKLETPIGPVEALISMSQKTYLDLHELVKSRNIIPRLADILEGNFGYRLGGLLTLERREGPER